MQMRPTRWGPGVSCFTSAPLMSSAGTVAVGHRDVWGVKEHVYASDGGETPLSPPWYKNHLKFSAKKVFLLNHGR